eukprot:CAMPEP_0181417462 /NCGR_PEP_ID=MMETSP1110-20121109/11054_1 /TAXON_ID=174948 /ORGANISM="Symbiodinium sp., Strain CCMP421" /LENGTH=197 /DNA_ID=CAMNT_0023540415 /DNA_START=12 /DNA_END=601 /DNA_ORIENTATION=+
MAGEEVFGKLKAELPRTGGMLKRSSTVWHLLNELLQSLSDPKVVQKKLEYIALRHMNADITTADVEVFKGILLEVCASKLGGLMTPEFQFGLGQIIVAVGMSLAKTHEHYAQRLKLLTECWKEVNVTEDDEANENAEEQHEHAQGHAEGHEDAQQDQSDAALNNMEKGENDAHGQWRKDDNMNIPKTFAAMARFNAA